MRRMKSARRRYAARERNGTRSVTFGRFAQGAPCAREASNPRRRTDVQDTHDAPFRIESRTHVLRNGMRIVAHEDRTAPLVAVHLMYRVGSRDERPGRTGLAHLLEHLMFEGSQHAPKGDFDDLLERVGGTNNGSTWLDRTNYYEIVPRTRWSFRSGWSATGWASSSPPSPPKPWSFSAGW
jgi:hypothetical protein